MGSHIDRQTDGLAESYLKGGLSRRAFVTRLLALGLAPGAVASVVAACSNPSPSTGSSSNASPGELAGNVRFLIGPWSNEEVAHQQHTAKAFQALHPKVTFSFRLYDWGSAGQQINTSVIEGAQDIYMTTESSYPDYEAHDTFVDLSSRVNAPSFAAEKAKYLYMDRIESYGPKILGLPISWHVEDAMFVNMDMVNAAGFDESFADTWPTFLEAVTKMTKPGKTFGFGIGIQIGGYGEWYQRLRAAGGSYLTPDHKTVNVNHPDVVLATQQFADLFKKGIAPPLGTYTYDETRRRRSPPQDGDLFLRPRHDDDAAREGPLQVAIAPVSARSGQPSQLQRLEPVHDQPSVIGPGSDVGSSQVLDLRAKRCLLGWPLGHLSGAGRRAQVRLQQVGGASARRGIRVVQEVRRRAGELLPVGRCRERRGGRDPELLRREGDGAAGRCQRREDRPAADGSCPMRLLAAGGASLDLARAVAGDSRLRR